MEYAVGVVISVGGDVMLQPVNRLVIGAVHRSLHVAKVELICENAAEKNNTEDDKYYAAIGDGRPPYLQSALLFVLWHVMVRIGSPATLSNYHNHSLQEIGRWCMNLGLQEDTEGDIRLAVLTRFCQTDLVSPVLQA